MVLARKLRPLLYLTILLCALSIIVSSVSLSGGSWYTRTAQNAAITNSSLEIEHGLFTGVKGRRFDAGADEKKDLAGEHRQALAPRTRVSQSTSLPL